MPECWACVGSEVSQITQAHGVPMPNLARTRVHPAILGDTTETDGLNENYRTLLLSMPVTPVDWLDSSSPNSITQLHLHTIPQLLLLPHSRLFGGVSLHNRFPTTSTPVLTHTNYDTISDSPCNETVTKLSRNLSFVQGAVLTFSLTFRLHSDACSVSSRLPPPGSVPSSCLKHASWCSTQDPQHHQSTVHLHSSPTTPIHLTITK